MKKVIHYFLPILLLVALVFICFGRTLNSYFIADDFGQVAYASWICKGNLSALWANFTGNYMQIPVMKIYRPFLLLSFMFDYALWHTNAFGYFLTNILALAASAVMLYLLLKEITRTWPDKNSILFSSLSAALFATNPLHCESISFISGRDNVFSTFFYLLSLWCFVRKGSGKNTKLLAIGIVSFFAALLFKETAIGLPAVLCGLCFFLPALFQFKNEGKYSLNERLQLAIKISAPIWITTVVYFIIRYLALGTFTGGYTGDVGAGLMANMIQRWTNYATVFRIMYPLNLGAFGVIGYYYWAVLSVLYAVLGTLALVRILNGQRQNNMLGFLVLWTVTTIVPVYQLWGLSENLEGSRFFFFLSIPLAMFLPLLIFGPINKNFETIETKKLEIAGAIAITLLVLLGANITGNNNIPWLHAGKQTRACLRETQRLANLAGTKKLALLGLPKEEQGAHMIYNGATLRVMLSPPFSKENYANKFITFDPLFYGIPELINTQRLKNVLRDRSIGGLFVWDEKALSYNSLPIPASEILSTMLPAAPIIFRTSSGLVAPITSNQGVIDRLTHHININDNQLFSAPAGFNPYQYDYLELKAKTVFPKELMFVFWRGMSPNNIEACDIKNPVRAEIVRSFSPTKIRIRLSDHWRWFTQGNINRLQIEFVPGKLVQVSDMHLVSSQSVAPAVEIVNSLPTNVGVYALTKSGLQLNYTGNSVHNCAAIKIEISKPNYFFEGLSPDQDRKAIMKTIIEPTNTGQVIITDKFFTSSAYYQVRACALDKSGNVIGEKSDPVTISAD